MSTVNAPQSGMEKVADLNDKDQQPKWKKLPQLLVKLALENRFVFDFIKFETYRQEVNASELPGFENDEIMPVEVSKRLGFLAGFIY